MHRDRKRKAIERQPRPDRVCGVCGANWGTEGPLPYGTSVVRLDDGSWVYTCRECRRGGE